MPCKTMTTARMQFGKLFAHGNFLLLTKDGQVKTHDGLNFDSDNFLEVVGMKDFLKRSVLVFRLANRPDLADGLNSFERESGRFL